MPRSWPQLAGAAGRDQLRIPLSRHSRIGVSSTGDGAIGAREPDRSSSHEAHSKPRRLPLFGQEPMRAGYWVFAILIPDSLVDRLMLWGSPTIAIGCLIYLALD